MPVYLNEGYPRSPDGKQWKHVEACAVLIERDRQGFRIEKIQRNMDTGKRRYSDHKRRRCPTCMPDSDWPSSEPHNPVEA